MPNRERVFTGVRSVTAKGENVMYDLQSKIDTAVFPGLQGGPHNHTIAGIRLISEEVEKGIEFIMLFVEFLKLFLHPPRSF